MKIEGRTYTTKNANYWWVMLLTGIILLLIGFWVICSPIEGYLSLSLAFAFGMLSAGLSEGVYALSNRRTVRIWGWVLTGGIMDVLLGGYLLFYPLITMMLLPFIVGLWVLFRGIISIMHSITLKNAAIGGWGWNLCAALLMTAFGAFIVAYPLYGVINIVIWTGLAFIVSGVFFMALSFKIKEVHFLV